MENWQYVICLEPTHLFVTIDCFPVGCFIAILCCVVLIGCDFMSSDINVSVLLLASELIQEQKMMNRNGCSSTTNRIDDVNVGIAAALSFSPVVAWLPHWLCFHFLWKPPWRLPAWVAFMDDGHDNMVDDDVDEHEHEAEAIIHAELNMKNAAAQVTADVQSLFQCCPSAMASVLLNLSCGSWSENLVRTGIIQVLIVRCSCSLIALHLATTNLLSNHYSFKLGGQWLVTDPVQLLFCNSQYTVTGLFWFKVIGLLPALVLSTYSVQLKCVGLTQFDSFLLSSMWPDKRSTICLVSVMPIQWPFFYCYGADDKQCTLLLFWGSNHGFNSIPKLMEGSTCLLLWFSESDEPISVYNISGLGASRLSRRGECQESSMPWARIRPWAEWLTGSCRLALGEQYYKKAPREQERGMEELSEPNLPLPFP